MSDEQTRCKEMVYRQHTWRSSACTRKAWKDGFCKQHHPDTVKARNEARRRVWEEQSKQSAWYLLERAKERIAELEKLVAHLRMGGVE